jgi:transcription antitermination factor NusG
MALHWYALRTKTRQEEAVWKQIQQMSYEAFFPRIKVRPVNPRSRKIKPYFPGYLFIRVDLEEVGISTFEWMPHSLGLVSFGGEPASVPDNLVYAVRQRVEEIAASGGELFDGLQAGDTVKISYGPFEGYEGIFDTRIPGGERVKIFLRLLNDKRLPIELNSSYIQKKK